MSPNYLSSACVFTSIRPENHVPGRIKWLFFEKFFYFVEDIVYCETELLVKDFIGS